ncbi:hypothetical protein WAF17_16540 [Bernardetia sp. ABR2-2B]|uniref:hypothetical protein n=1 Tax=Bernardetia sp. ABR2-2B TaxID=3127472 RepID=UPI0030D1B004
MLKNIFTFIIAVATLAIAFFIALCLLFFVIKKDVDDSYKLTDYELKVGEVWKEIKPREASTLKADDTVTIIYVGKNDVDQDIVDVKYHTGSEMSMYGIELVQRFEKVE